MEPVNGLGALSEIVRRKLREGASSSARKDGAAHEPARAGAQRLAIGELERQLRIKLKELGPDALKSPSAKRSIIASLLICELDERLHNESKFNALVRGIQQSIDEDENLRTRFNSVIEQLSR
jgi:hypothetical protein